MVKAVFITKIDSSYNDLPEDCYHFPKSYLKRIEATIGDWIIYCRRQRRFFIAADKIRNVSQAGNIRGRLLVYGE